MDAPQENSPAAVPPAPATPEHAPPPFLAHHYQTAAQQQMAGKLGMWLFLATEILMFSGLFCAYAVYRANHSEIFTRSAQYLNWKLGALNTLVLITSSLTIALAVRCAQQNQRRAVLALLGLTLLGGVTFMSVKAVEYHDKWKHHLLPGTYFHPEEAHEAPMPVAPAVKPPVPATPQAATSGPKSDPYLGPLGSDGPQGLAANWSPARPAHEEDLPAYAHIFFGIYFVMTGLHGLHVLVGMGVISWMMLRTWRGEFSSEYHTPLELTGLYWHLVDVIWIYLFPLLYLIH